MTPAGASTKVSATSQETFIIEKVSRWRRVAVIILNLVRLAVHTCLLLVGSLWLASTSSMEAIILNSTALVCLKVDQVLFAALAPATLKELMGKMEPLPLPERRHWHGLSCSPFLTMLGGIALVTTIF